MPKEKKPFVDFRDIRSRLTMEQVLAHYNLLDTFKRGGHTLSGPCPIHKGTNKTQFRVDLEKNLWNCFSECKHGGNTLDFICKMENLNIHDAALKACEWFNIPIDEVQASDDAGKEENAAPKAAAKSAPAATPKPEDNTPNKPLGFKLDKLQRDHPYLTNARGLTQETIIDFGLGCFTGDRGMMVGYIVIPILNVKGEVVAYAGRWPGEPPDKDTPKYKLPAGFKKSLELFNADRAFKETGPLAVVEGFFDAIKLHQNGWRKTVALMGSSMSIAQEELIRQHVVTTSHIIVMLDEDDAGKAARDEIAGRLAKYCFVKTHVFEQPGTQPEHLGFSDVQEIMEGVP